MFCDSTLPERRSLFTSSWDLNPIEQVWLYLRGRILSHRLFDTVDAIVDACCDAWNAILAEPGRVANLGHYGNL